MPKGKRHSAEFKFKVALEAAKGTMTLNELASEYSLHPSQISARKGRLMNEGANILGAATEFLPIGVEIGWVVPSRLSSRRGHLLSHLTIHEAHPGQDQPAQVAASHLPPVLR